MKAKAKISYEVEFDFDVPDCLVDSYKLTDSADMFERILDIAYDAAPIPCDTNGRPVYSESCITKISDENDKVFLFNY